MNPAATERSFFAVLLLYVAGLVFCVGLGLSAGAVSISWPEMLQVVKSFYSPVPELDSSNVAILIARVWRILACVCIGASLALCGSVLQRLLRNPLADPFVLGVSAGGTTAVVTTLVLFGVPLGSYVWGIQVQFLASLVGCIGALLFVLMLKRKLSAASAESTLPLVGLVLNAFLSSVLMVVVSLADPFRMAEAQRWMLGFVSFVTPWQVGILATVLIVAGGFLLFMRKAVDALAFGHDFARSVGVSAKNAERNCLLAASALVAAVVAVAGSVGFIGLIVPNICRKLHAKNPRLEWPASMLLGASTMVAADLLSRHLAAPGELPVGIFTAALGAPALILILLGKSRRGAPSA